MAGGEPPTKYQVRCSTPESLVGGDERLNFEINGNSKAVSVKIGQLSRKLVESLPDKALDLLEIAALV